jgi:hypothetical protein
VPFLLFTFFSFLAIFQALQNTFLILHDFQWFFFFCHILGFTVCISHFLPFSVFSPYSRSYSVHFSFSTFFSVFCHNPGPTMCVSHFPWFSVFSPYSRS